MNLTSSPTKCVANTNFFDLFDLCKASLNQSCNLCSLPTRAFLRCGRSDPALYISVHTSQAPIVKGITFVSFLRVRPLRGIPADGQWWLKQAIVLGIPHGKGVSDAVRKGSAQSMSRLSKPTDCFVFVLAESDHINFVVPYCSCCLCLYFGSSIVLVTYFVNFW